MDLALYAQIVRRRWRLFVCGLIAAILLSLLAYISIGPGGIHYRDQESWQSDATIFITQSGFPWGRAYEQYLSGDPARNVPPVPLGDNSRLSYLAMLYAQLANGDAVQNSIFHGRPDSGRSLVASAVAPASAPSGTVLPLLQLRATAPTKREAVDLAHRSTTAFTTYLVHEQQEARIGQAERVVTQVLNSGTGAIRVAGRGKTVPILIFLAVMVAVFGLGFVLENIKAKSGEGLASEETLAPATAASGDGSVVVRERLRTSALGEREAAGDEGSDATADSRARTTTRTRRAAQPRSRAASRSSGNGAAGSVGDSRAPPFIDPADAGDQGSKAPSGRTRPATRSRRAAQPRSRTASRSAKTEPKPMQVSESEDGGTPAAGDSGEGALVVPERLGPRALVKGEATGDEGSDAPAGKRARTTTPRRGAAQPRSRTASRSSANSPAVQPEDSPPPPFLGPAHAAEAADSKAPADTRVRPATRTRKASQPRSRPASRSASTKPKPVEPALSEDGQPPKAAAPAEGAVVPEASPPPPAKLEETSEEARVVSDETRVVAVGGETGAEASPGKQPAEAADGSGPVTTISEEGEPSAGDRAEEKGTGADVEAGEDAGPPVDTDSSLASELSLQTKKPTPQRPR
jgi:hypothetical protein